ncbi:hypothetical protein KQX54_020797 [Cotesia glomerata]|uniref:Uncharacterized protein n=1 Tax=Cotesia glomerata TaxID=32391 RepID=A0AAV7IDF9_COTGL|nr:hypothetical protein KQX54_020797 [Cotesia glomerata]
MRLLRRCERLQLDLRSERENVIVMEGTGQYYPPASILFTSKAKSFALTKMAYSTTPRPGERSISTLYITPTHVALLSLCLSLGTGVIDRREHYDNVSYSVARVPDSPAAVALLSSGGVLSLANSSRMALASSGAAIHTARPPPVSSLLLLSLCRGSTLLLGL